MMRKWFTALAVLLGFMVSTQAWAWWVFGPAYDITPSKALNLNLNDFSGKKQNLNPYVLTLGLKAYACARQRGYDRQEVLTIIDYSLPAVEPRMWVIDLRHLRIKYNELVAHGEKSGDMVGKYFSNDMNSHESSLGVFLTANSYNGKDGYALRLKGLEPGYNDNALRRAIVFHGADYVSANRVMSRGQLGRSWGCPALAKNMARPTIDTIKDGTLVFAYAPQGGYLRHSEYLHCSA